MALNSCFRHGNFTGEDCPKCAIAAAERAVLDWVEEWNDDPVVFDLGLAERRQALRDAIRRGEA